MASVPDGASRYASGMALDLDPRHLSLPTQPQPRAHGDALGLVAEETVLPVDGRGAATTVRAALGELLDGRGGRHG